MVRVWVRARVRVWVWVRGRVRDRFRVMFSVRVRVSSKHLGCVAIRAHSHPQLCARESTVPSAASLFCHSVAFLSPN
jgi:hypothetical protein